MREDAEACAGAKQRAQWAAKIIKKKWPDKLVPNAVHWCMQLRENCTHVKARESSLQKIALPHLAGGQAAAEHTQALGGGQISGQVPLKVHLVQVRHVQGLVGRLPRGGHRLGPGAG